MVRDAATGKQYRIELHASWRLDEANRVRADLRTRAAGGEPGAEAGWVTVSWRSLTDALTDALTEAPVIGWLAKRTRSFQETIGIPDAASALGLIDIDIELSLGETVFGRPISCSARAETRPTHWIVSEPAAWWARVAIFRAGVPTPAEFGEA